MISLLLGTLAVLLLLLTLPLTLELGLLTFAFVFLERRKRSAAETGVPFRLAVIVPAHNEAAGIGSTVHSLLVAREQSLKADVRILVIAHNCTDATAEHARAAGAEVRILDGPEGKGAALAFAFHTIPADGFLVIDADSIVDPALIERVQSLLASGTEALQCRYEALPATSLRGRLGAIAFRAINVVRPAGRQRLGLSCGILGNGFALRRSVLERIPYSAFSVIEDIEYHLALVRARLRVRYVDDVAVRSTIATTRNQHARWEGGRLGMMWMSFSSLLPQVLLGRVRLLEPALDLAGLPIAQQTALLLIGLLLPFWPMRLYCAIALVVLILHVAAAVVYSDDPTSDSRALLYAPVYLLWKLLSLPAILRGSRKDSAWVRTERDIDPLQTGRHSEQSEEPPHFARRSEIATEAEVHPALDPADEPPHELSTHRVGRNVSATILARAGYMVSRIAIPPFVLAHISLESYGIWQTAFILVNYLGITTMGISNVYIKYVAEYGARKQYERANQLLSTGLTVTIPLCAMIFAGLVAFWPLAQRKLGIPTALAAESKEAVLIVVAVFLSGIALGAFQDALTGAQEIVLTQWFWVAGYVVEMVLLFVLVGRGRGIRGMAEAFLARTLLNILLCMIWSFRRLPWLRLSPSRFRRDALRSVFHFGGVVQVQTLLAVVINSIERVAGLAVGMGVTAVGIFDLGKKWPQSVATLPMSFFNAFLPAASHIEAQHSGDASASTRIASIRAFYLQGARHANLISGCFCALMALLPGAIMAVWLGPALRNAPGAVTLFCIFSISIQVHMLTGPGTSILRGIGRIYEEFAYLLPNIVFILITLPIARVLFHGWTVVAVGSAVAVSTLLAATVFLLRAHRVLQVPAAAYCRQVLWPGLVPYLLAATLAWPIAHLVNSVSRWHGAGILAAAGLVYTLVLAGLLDALLLSEHEKAQWRTALARTLSLIRRRTAWSSEG